MPGAIRDRLGDTADLDVAAGRWAATEELRLDGWHADGARDLLAALSGLARAARGEGRELWYWWSL